MNWGQGLMMFVGVIATAKSGDHLNPTTTIGPFVNDIARGKLAMDFDTVMAHLGGQFVESLVGAFLCQVAYKQRFSEGSDQGARLGVFCTAPTIRSLLFNLLTEIVGTFMLVLVVIASGPYVINTKDDAINLGRPGVFDVALPIAIIGAGLGNPTGYAINPTGDLCPRIMHVILSIKGKGGSDWNYSQAPVIGPMIGSLLDGLLAAPLLVFLLQ